MLAMIVWFSQNLVLFSNLPQTAINIVRNSADSQRLHTIPYSGNLLQTLINQRSPAAQLMAEPNKGREEDAKKGRGFITCKRDGVKVFPEQVKKGVVLRM